LDSLFGGRFRSGFGSTEVEHFGKFVTVLSESALSGSELSDTDRRLIPEWKERFDASLKEMLSIIGRIPHNCQADAQWCLWHLMVSSFLIGSSVTVSPSARKRTRSEQAGKIREKLRSIEARRSSEPTSRPAIIEEYILKNGLGAKASTYRPSLNIALKAKGHKPANPKELSGYRKRLKSRNS
jgi:hypothetical protein